MTKPVMDGNGWIKLGTVVSFGSLALAVLGGKRRLAAVSALMAGAFLEKWGDMRLEKRVAELLTKADQENPGEATAALTALLESGDRP